MESNTAAIRKNEPGTLALDAAATTSQLTPASPFGKSWAHFIAGGLGGMTSATVTAPLDVLRTRLQSDYYRSQPGPGSASASASAGRHGSVVRHIRETVDILAAVPRQEGWRALFKGLGPNLVGVVPARAIHFYVYGNGKAAYSNWFNNGREAPWIHALSAVSAGVATCTATNPLWVIKTRLQLDKSSAAAAAAAAGGSSGATAQRQYRNALDCVRKTVRAEGVAGLYRGLGASYLGVSETTVQWVLYERAKRVIAGRARRLEQAGREPGWWDSALQGAGPAIASGLSKCMATVLAYPHEVLRTRLRQSPNPDGSARYAGIVDCCRSMVRQEGFAALYGGLVPHLMRTVPSAAIMFATYEAVLPRFGAKASLD